MTQSQELEHLYGAPKLFSLSLVVFHKPICCHSTLKETTSLKTFDSYSRKSKRTYERTYLDECIFWQNLRRRAKISSFFPGNDTPDKALEQF